MLDLVGREVRLVDTLKTKETFELVRNHLVKIRCDGYLIPNS